MWGYVKSLVYADKPQTLDYLEDNIRRVITDIRPQMLEKVIENWTSRLNYIQASRGNHMPEIIFKIIFGNDGRRTIWRKPNTALDPKNLRPTVKHGVGSVTVWGCMASNGVDGIMDYRWHNGS
ncbi:hypothetical protein TNCV_2050561 [Trichonephila clavipes]|nr:hypothetical protein TNCV_2050561 [Trichonephila clavipes]